MGSDRDRRIPLMLLGGFLGSGKTTWLRHQLHIGALTDAIVIVNEAADVPVDDLLLFKSSRVRALAGGCACCHGRTELIELLRQLCDQKVSSRNQDEFRQIVLETSGLADPGPIVEAIRTDPVLQHHIVVHEIIVAVDALHGLGYLRREPLGRRQVETADRLVVTKADASSRVELGRLAATLHRANPGAEINAAAMGSPVDLPDFSAIQAESITLEEVVDNEPVISTVLKLDSSTDWTAFGIWLSALLHARGDDIIRVKGVVRTPSGRLLLQSVRRIVQSPEILPDHVGASEDDNSVVFIGKGFRPQDLHPSLRRFSGTA